MPPPRNPTKTVSQGTIPRAWAMSMAGESRDQKAAATITPPASPSMASITFWLGRRMRNTTQAPSAVKAQVSRVATSACSGKASWARLSSITFLLGINCPGLGWAQAGTLYPMRPGGKRVPVAVGRGRNLWGSCRGPEEARSFGHRFRLFIIECIAYHLSIFERKCRFCCIFGKYVVYSFYPYQMGGAYHG